MSTRRTRSSRPRKARTTDAPPTEITVGTVASPAPDLARLPATETGQLRALEAGWDELLG